MKAIRGPLLLAAFAFGLWALFWRSNPGGVSDAEYSKFQNLRPPKLLYSCVTTPTREAFYAEERACLKTGRSNCDASITDMVEAGTRKEVNYVAGDSTYDRLLDEVKRSCRLSAGDKGTIDFRVIEADKS